MDVPRNKKLDRKYLDHLAGILRPIVRERFGGNGTAFAKHVEVSQPQIAQLLSPTGGAGVGIVVLLQLRKYLQVSIDEMLGLPPLTARAVPVNEVEAAVERALDKRFPREDDAKPSPSAVPDPPQAKRKKLD